MRENVGAESVSNAPGWSRVVFIAAVCALGGIGFLGATILMNGRVVSSYQRSAAAVGETLTPAAAPQPVPAAGVKSRPPANDRFLPIDIVSRGEINKARLARCRSHIEAGRPFEALSLKRMAAIRETRRTADPEAICVEYFAIESRTEP